MNKFNANVRIGNWYDDLMLQDEKTKQYIRKSKNGELKVQKARQLFLSLLQEIPLTFPVVGLSYGAVIEIVSPENPPKTEYKLKEKQGIALAANIEFENIDERCTFEKNDSVIGTGLLTPCARNVWTLIPEDESKKGKELRYGDTFHIRLFKSDHPLYVYAPVNTPLEKKGECKKIVPRLQSKMNYLTRHVKQVFILRGKETGKFNKFMVVHYNPRLRYDNEGAVVPPFEKIGIVQAATFQGLAVETETWIPTYFGMECEVSVHTYKDPRDPFKPDPKNYWSFILSMP